MQKQISTAVIKRMPRYYRYLGDLLDAGVERISSGELSTLMKVTASQIRQDLNNFGEFGQQGYGYNVSYLYQEIGKILGIDKRHPMIVLGAGHLGQAIANHYDFLRRGFEVVALFDVDPDLKGVEVNGMPVRMMDELDDFVRNHNIDIAILTLPKSSAQEMAERVTSLGIKAIWNFAPFEAELPKGTIVENVHLSDSLMTLSYRIAEQKKEKK